MAARIRRVWPRSLAGQLALAIAIALFLAQAINFALLLRERNRYRFEQATGPAVARIVDAVDGANTGRAGETIRGVRQLPSSPVGGGEHHRADVEDGLRHALADAGLRVGRIDAVVRDVQPGEPRISPRRLRRLQDAGGELVIAVERPGKGWLALRAPWPRDDARLVVGLIVQTLVLYTVILLLVLWATRRLSRPLRMLAEATHDFTPGRSEPVMEHGPQDVREVIAAFNLLTGRVTVMLDEKDRMLGAIGHDLRTPLAALRVRVESVEDAEDRERMAATIDEMNRTLDDILSLARLGRPSEPPTDVDLAALVDAVVDDFRELGADVAFDEAERIRMRLRPSLIRRAVRNLIENAIKYGGAVEVMVRAEPEMVRVVVCDRGPGIPPEQLDAVFEAFTRLEASRNSETGGIGLGLALARAIVREAGGEITLANRDGGGLAATMTLPRGS